MLLLDRDLGVWWVTTEHVGRQSRQHVSKTSFCVAAAKGQLSRYRSTHETTKIERSRRQNVWKECSRQIVESSSPRNYRGWQRSHCNHRGRSLIICNAMENWFLPSSPHDYKYSTISSTSSQRGLSPIEHEAQRATISRKRTYRLLRAVRPWNVPSAKVVTLVS